jgi:hypothetical protein
MHLTLSVGCIEITQRKNTGNPTVWASMLYGNTLVFCMLNVFAL